MYYEPAAFEATQYVQRTHGLDIVEMKKLKLGPYILDNKLQLDESTFVKVSMEGSSSDIEEMMELQGEYGSSHSLAMKGL